MKAIELVRHGEADKAFRFTQKELADPSENEVQIKVAYSGLNFADSSPEEHYIPMHLKTLPFLAMM